MVRKYTNNHSTKAAFLGIFSLNTLIVIHLVKINLNGYLY